MKMTPSNIKMLASLGSRGAFGMACLDLAAERDDFMVATADLAVSSGLSRFGKAYPDRLVNVGIAEQSLISVAAGLAAGGFMTFAATFATFISMRALDQVRTYMGYMNMNVKAVGVASGFAMGHFGNSHYGLEDVAAIRAIPNITLICPADGLSLFKAARAVADFDGPAYMRLTGVAPAPVVYGEDFDFRLGRAVRLREGSDVAIVSNGAVLSQCLNAAAMLESCGVSSEVADMHTIKPLDGAFLDSLSGRQAVVTVEEHNVIGGLGGAVAEHYASKKSDWPPLLRLGVNDAYGKAGAYPWLLEKHGLDAKSIAGSILDFLGRDGINK